MPIKILLADKSITIQKVVEMLFSGKEYEVLCVSDGETALNEATRVVPDVVLADIDLPRMGGYSFSERMKQVPSLAQTPVILMMSRDDVFDEAKARKASIIDNIAKPFESQELISKVKKAVSAAPPRPGQPAPPATGPAAVKPQTPPRPAGAPPAGFRAAAPKQPPPKDIFDIIQDAPGHADMKHSAEDSVYEVEPVIEVEEPAAPDASGALPVGEKAVAEMRENLGLSAKNAKAGQDIVSFESLDMAMSTAKEYMPPKREEPRRPEPSVPLSDERLRAIAEEIVTRIAREHFKVSLDRPQVSEETVRSAVEESVSGIVREVARDVIEKVAWEVVPDLAAMLIREEIERLKAET